MVFPGTQVMKRVLGAKSLVDVVLQSCITLGGEPIIPKPSEFLQES